MRPRRPPTKLVRVRIEDAAELEAMAKRANQQMPDFQGELIRAYKRARKR